MQWGTVPDWLTFLATAATALAAWKALSSWKQQLEGRTRHTVANEIAAAAHALRYAFYDARSPMLWAGEFPDTYRNRRMGEKPTRDDNAKEHAFVYRNRIKALWPHILECAKLRPKAGITFGDACADALEELAKKARELEFLAEERVEQIRVGPEIVALWTDQDWVKRVKESIEVRSDLKKVFRKSSRRQCATCSKNLVSRTRRYQPNSPGFRWRASANCGLRELV